MKVLLIGASGTIGQYIYNELDKDSDIITASHSSGQLQVDLGDAESIAAMYQQAGSIDAVICVASRGVVFNSLNEMTIADYITSAQQKQFGQIQVALAALPHLIDGGSITLTTGIMNHDFVKGGSAAAMVNNAVEGFAQAAALDMPRGIRINVVSPALLDDSKEKYAALCPGFEPVKGEVVARAYRKSVCGIQTGRIYRPE